ncbi:unnamed protein product [Oreochromis niloticus]|nr:unnamed protein product [Mustela putorius furo]
MLKEVRAESVEDSDEDSFFIGELFLGAVTEPKTTVIEESGSDADWDIELLVNSSPVDFKIDTGADTSVMTETTFNKLQQRPKLIQCKPTVYSPGGKVKCVGKFLATTVYKGQKYQYWITVIKGQYASNLLGLVARVNKISSDLTEDVFGEIGLLNCEPVKIELTEDAVPYSVTTPRRVPFPLLPKVEKEIKRMLKLGIIEEVTEPTDWCAPMVPAPKRNKDEVRVCVDLKRLNKGVKRERYILPTLDDITPKLAGAKVFSTLDASSGFWQIPLDPSCQKLTTFITSMGRFCFRRLPFGITSAPEIFQRLMSTLLKGLEGTVVVMDDILVFGANKEEHDQRLDAVLQTIKASGLKLNRTKCHFGKNELQFFSHIISADGVKPDDGKVEAIARMPSPTNVEQLRQVLGLINYVGKFLPGLSTVLHPLSNLLKKETVWAWGEPQEQAFNKAKAMLVAAPALCYYDAGRPTVVSVDASSYGLGAALLQDHEGELRPVAFCSRMLTDAEKRYSQIEKECLASVWACERFAHYIQGMGHVRLQTDHKPLINLYDLDKTPLRCQRLLMRLMRFNVTAEHVPGKQLVVADALSRHPLHGCYPSETDSQVKAYVSNVVTSKPIKSHKLEEIRRVTQRDPELQKAIIFIRQGWPRRMAKSSPLQGFYPARSHLSESDATGASPAQLMTGRQIRTTVPVLEKTLLPSPVNRDTVCQRDAAAKDSYRFFYNRRHSARPLPELLPGQDVVVKLDGEKGWTTPAKVISKSKEPRSYLVEMANGNVTRRNRRHLLPVPGTADPEEQQQSTVPATPTTPTKGAAASQEPPVRQVLPVPVLGSPLHPTTPVRATSRGQEIKVPLRFRD